jgi:hypothetical protein
MNELMKHLDLKSHTIFNGNLSSAQSYKVNQQ